MRVISDWRMKPRGFGSTYPHSALVTFWPWAKCTCRNWDNMLAFGHEVTCPRRRRWKDFR
jgi:hypothetical protein